jgi:hypothetical protein
MLPTLHASSSSYSSPTPLSLLHPCARATMTRAVRRPPRRRRRFHAPHLSLRPLSSTQRDQESVESSFALFSPFATHAVSPFASAAPFSSPVKYGSPWVALTERSSHPLILVVASPCLADTRQALRAPQFRSEPSSRRSAAAAASSSPWSSLPRPSLAQIDPGSSFLTSPGSFSTLPSSSKRPEYRPHRSTSPPAASLRRATTPSRLSSIPS